LDVLETSANRKATALVGYGSAEFGDEARFTGASFSRDDDNGTFPALRCAIPLGQQLKLWSSADEMIGAHG